MPITTQFNYNTPIGFSRKNGIPTKGGSVGPSKFRKNAAWAACRRHTELVKSESVSYIGKSADY
jgi:hypothetical protein